VRLAIQGRRLNDRGEIVAITATHTPNSDRTTVTSVIPLGKGALLNLAVVAESGTPLFGQTFVMLQLIRGLTGPVVVLGALLQGFVTSTQILAWPGSPLQHSFEGQGVARVITGTLPAAGAEISETVPTGARWELVKFSTQFTCSAAAATRQIALRIADASGNAQFLSPSVTNLTANQVAPHAWAQGTALSALLENITALMGLPMRLVLPAGASIQTRTTAMQAGDQFLAPIYTVLEWPEVP
jgi:hypothetical protein